MPDKRSTKRLIRKQSLWSKISSYPFDLYLRLNEDLSLVDWDARSTSIGIPSGIACNVLLLICKAYWMTQNTTSSDIFKYASFNGEAQIFSHEQKTPIMSVFFTFLTLALVIICIFNTVVCFSKTKSYTLTARSSESNPGTPSAHKETYIASNGVSTSPIKRMLTAVWSGKTRTDSDKVWVLDAWDPPTFSLYFGSIFSPVHLSTIWCLPVNIKSVLALVGFSSYTYYITGAFLVLVKDKSIVYSEVMNEYTKKTVSPIIAAVRRDVCVGTDDDHAVFYSPSQNAKFIKRDVRPVLLRHSMSSTNLSPWQSPSPVVRVNSSRFASPTRPSLNSMSNSPSLDSLRYKASLNSLKLGRTASPPRPKSPLKESLAYSEKKDYDRSF